MKKNTYTVTYYDKDGKWEDRNEEIASEAEAVTIAKENVALKGHAIVSHVVTEDLFSVERVDARTVKKIK